MSIARPFCVIPETVCADEKVLLSKKLASKKENRANLFMAAFDFVDKIVVCLLPFTATYFGIMLFFQSDLKSVESLFCESFRTLLQAIAKRKSHLEMRLLPLSFIRYLLRDPYALLPPFS